MKSGNCDVVLRNESLYTPKSADNKFIFDKELFLADKEGYVASTHSVIVSCPDGEKHSCVLIAGGGGTSIHENSALVHADKLFAAAGKYVCALRLPMLEVEWQTQTDWVTCFGIYHSPRHKCYISHDECDILRLSYSGEIVWQASGKDIFTGEFALHEDFISVIDFNDESYRIDIETGACKLTAG